MTSWVSGFSFRSPTVERGLAARRPAAQQRPQPRQQLLALERLDQVVVGAGVEALDPGLDRVARGQHQDRDVVVGSRSVLATSIPSSPGQAEVEDHQVGQEGVGLVERR